MKNVTSPVETLRKRGFQVSYAKRLEVSEWKVLLALAYDGPRTMYAIHKKNNMQYSNVHNSMSNLRKIRWVKIIKRILSEKNLPKNVYSLTLEGLLWTLSRIPRAYPAGWLDLSDHDHLEGRLNPAEALEMLQRKEKESTNLSMTHDLKSRDDVFKHLVFLFDIDKVAKNYADFLPLIFGRWDIYKNIGIEQSLFRYFARSAFASLDEYYHNTGSKDKFGSLGRVFTYKVFHELLESYSETAYSLSGDAESYKQESAKQIRAAFKDNVQLEDLCQRICREIIHEKTESLGFFRLLEKT